MSWLRHIGPRALMRAVVVSVITVAAADYLLGRRRDHVCDWLDGTPGISCPGIAEPANTAASLVLFTGLLAAAVLVLAQRAIRGAWITSVTNGQEMSPVPTLWRVVAFLQWAAVIGALTLMQGLTSERYDLLRADGIGTGSVLVTAALVIGSAWLWTSWREHRTYAWATRVHGAPFLPAVLRGEWNDYHDQFHQPRAREARDSDFNSIAEAQRNDDRSWFIVECDVCGFTSGFHESRFEASQIADQHQRETSP